MTMGAHVSSFNWLGGPQRLAQDLTQVARAAEDNGFDKLSVMDHFVADRPQRPSEHEMLEARAGRTEYAPAIDTASL